MKELLFCFYTENTLESVAHVMIKQLKLEYHHWEA